MNILHIVTLNLPPKLQQQVHKHLLQHSKIDIQKQESPANGAVQHTRACVTETLSVSKGFSNRSRKGLHVMFVL